MEYWSSIIGTSAVWNIGPTLRIKRATQELSITRIADPECFPHQNLIKVNYQTFIKYLNTNHISEIQETYEMRAFTTEEIGDFANQTGFTLVHSAEWMTGCIPSKETGNFHNFEEDLITI